MRRSLKIGIIACASILIATLSAIPFFIDDEAIRNTLEDQLTTALGQPVHIEKLSFRLLPYPTLQLSQCHTAFGDTPDLALKMDRIRAALSMQALMAGAIVVKRFDIDGVALNEQLLEHLRNLTKDASGEDVQMIVPLRLQRATLRDVVWHDSGGQAVGPWSIEVHWEDGLRPRLVSFQQNDGRVRGQADLVAEAIDVQLEARDWQPPRADLPFLKSLQLNGRYSDETFSVNALKADLFGGQVAMQGKIDWRQAWHIQARIEGSNIALPRVLSAFGTKPVLTGRVTGNCALTLQAGTPAQLFEQPLLDCDLTRDVADLSTHFLLKTTPAKQALEFEVTARNLLLPLGPPLDLKHLKARGKLVSHKLVLDTVEIEGYQGRLEGRGTLGWKRDWNFEFVSQGRSLRLEPLLEVFEQRKLDGSLDGECSGKLRGKTFNALFRNPTLNCDFRIANGVLYNTDLEQAASLIKRDTDTTGDTPFDQLNGRLHMAKGRIRLDEINIRSTALEAKGHVVIDSTDQLAGEMSVGLKNTGGMVSVPLSVSGVVSEPVLRPTKSAMAGGVAGTAILGPGVGTAIGVKVGEAVQKFTRWLKPAEKPANAD